MPGPRFDYEYPARFAKARDGACIELILDLGFNMVINIQFRLDKVDVWGLAAPGDKKWVAIEAHKFVTNELTEAEEITVHSCRHENGVYFADIYYRKPGDKKMRDISKALVKHALATPRLKPKKVKNARVQD